MTLLNLTVWPPEVENIKGDELWLLGIIRREDQETLERTAQNVRPHEQERTKDFYRDTHVCVAFQLRPPPLEQMDPNRKPNSTSGFLVHFMTKADLGPRTCTVALGWDNNIRTLLATIIVRIYTSNTDREYHFHFRLVSPYAPRVPKEERSALDVLRARCKA